MGVLVMIDIASAIITLLNVVGFFLLFFTALLTSWEGLGILIILLALFLSKDKLHSIKNTGEIVFFVALFFFIWEGFGYLMGKTNNIFASIFSKLIILGGFFILIGLVFYLKSHFLEPHKNA